MQQITRGDYLEDLITIYIENNLQQGLDDLYSMFVFQCGEIQKQLTPAPVIKISFTEAESKLLTNYNTCYLAGITKDGHKETFNGSISFNTRGEVVYYEPTPNSSLQASTTSTIACPCTGISGVFANCTQPAIKAYFSLNYVPTKLSELQNDTDFQDGLQVAESISIHNSSTEAHPYIQGLISDEVSVRASETEALGVRIDNEVSIRASQTEALSVSIQAETTAREQAISLAISTTEGYADTLVSSATTAINTTIGDLSQLDTSVKSSVTSAINAEVATRLSADNNLQGQIDGLAAASDVTDIVGTYAELQAYDTQHLNDNDIIKVLDDSTHDDQPSYYRFDKDTDTFSYIGSESASYTKAQSDSIFVTQTTEINGHALSSNINLTPSDIGALADNYATVISANTSAIATNTSAIASNTSVIAQHTTAIARNTSAISTINGKIPTDASSTNKLVSASTLSASIADFANQDLSNLTSNGEARLHALKAYADNGELLTDADGLSFVKNYAHSTFDLSKFYVNGSPNITSDGIYQATGTNNYLKIPIDLSNEDDYEIIFPVNWDNLTGTSNTIIFSGSANNKGLGIAFQNTYERIVSYGGSTGFNDVFSAQATPNVKGKLIKFKYKNNIYSLSTSSDGLSWTESWKVTSSTKLALGSTINICQSANFSNAWNIIVDLKQVLVKIDGVEVFSGNKTGIDTIKPDDYTVVGAPTISADGIASGFSYSNYVTIPANITSNYRFEGSFTNNALTTGKNVFQLTDSALQLNFNGSGSMQALVSIDGANTNLGVVSYSTTGSSEFDFYYENNNNTWTFGIKQGDGEWATKTATLSSGTYLTNIMCRVSDIKLDLNSFKEYQNGSLVYQPCLKIPYTESKTGSKIVDSIYRDRVNDMAEQLGYANYYTLSDTDFTLPQVELYGLIGQRTLRDSYRNGATYWELWSDRTLEIGGTCTSGVEYNLPRNFTSENDYILSVPYSAKTASSFTPTTSGDFIAKGLGVL